MSNDELTVCAEHLAYLRSQLSDLYGLDSSVDPGMLDRLIVQESYRRDQWIRLIFSTGWLVTLAVIIALMLGCLMYVR